MGMAYFDMGTFRKMQSETLPDQHAQCTEGEDPHEDPEDTDIVREEGLLCGEECKDKENVGEDYLWKSGCSKSGYDERVRRDRNEPGWL